MSYQKFIYFIVFTALLAAIAFVAAEDQTEDEDIKVDEDKLKYTKGSGCAYCQYCQFCKLCDVDCPCETGPTKPNCHMCKYCKLCYVCDSICNTICQPGGMLDRFSAKIVNALPWYDTDEVDKDIEGVRHWIDEKREEL